EESLMTRKPRKSSRVTCTALVWIDDSPRRKSELKLYRRRCTETERNAHVLRVFEEQDIPAYMSWMDSEFRDQITAVYEIQRQVEDLSELIDEVRDYADARGISQRAAYSAIKAARDAGGTDSLWDELDEELKDVDFDDVDPFDEVKRAVADMLGVDPDE